MLNYANNQIISYDNLRNAIKKCDISLIKNILYMKKKMVNNEKQFLEFINRKDSNGSTLMHHASNIGCIEIVELLIEYGADINVQDSYLGYTPLHCCAYKKHTQLMEFLIENKAIETIPNLYGKTAKDFLSRT